MNPMTINVSLSRLPPVNPLINSFKVVIYIVAFTGIYDFIDVLI